MAPQLRTILHLRFVGVPDPERAVRGARGDVLARRVPGDGADGVGARAAGGWVVVGLGFQRGEEGGEAVFGDGFAGGKGRHGCGRMVRCKGDVGRGCFSQNSWLYC